MEKMSLNEFLIKWDLSLRAIVKEGDRLGVKVSFGTLAAVSSGKLRDSTGKLSRSLYRLDERLTNEKNEHARPRYRRSNEAVRVVAARARLSGTLR